MSDQQIPEHLSKSLKAREQKGLLRKLNTKFPKIDLCSNDYLGFSKLGLICEENQKSKVKSQKSKAREEGPVSKISVKLDGITFDFDLGFNAEPILDAALKQGADLPFSCKGGVCCTCKAKLLEGEVDMEVHWGLEHEEIEQGYILTCQSHPKTERVVVDFDIK
jgi:ring-1,2-phenylacetyl-CoA epoxidase subunit PaaE